MAQKSKYKSILSGSGMTHREVRTIEDTPSLAPKGPSGGHLQRASAVCNVLDECLRLSAMLRGDLFGEGEPSSGQDAPRNGNVDSLINDALEMAGSLREELEVIVQRVNPASVKAVSRG